MLSGQVGRIGLGVFIGGATAISRQVPVESAALRMLQGILRLGISTGTAAAICGEMQLGEDARAVGIDTTQETSVLGEVCRMGEVGWHLLAMSA